MSRDPDAPSDPRDDAIALHRRDIDRIDRTIVALVAERMRIGLALGAIKRAADRPVRSATREAEVLARVRAAAASPLSAVSAERIFSAIIEETSDLQAGSHVPDRPAGT